MRSRCAPTWGLVRERYRSRRDLVDCLRKEEGMKGMIMALALVVTALLGCDRRSSHGHVDADKVRIAIHRDGIGYLIAQAEGIFDTTGMFAGTALLAIAVLAISAIVSRAERTLLRWKPAQGTFPQPASSMNFGRFPRVCDYPLQFTEQWICSKVSVWASDLSHFAGGQDSG